MVLRGSAQKITNFLSLLTKTVQICFPPTVTYPFYPALIHPCPHFPSPTCGSGRKVDAHTIKTQRKSFLETLGRSLVAQQFETRAALIESNPSGYNTAVMKAFELCGRKLNGPKPSTTCQEQQAKKRGRCALCVGNDNKYSQKCAACHRFVCKAHCIIEPFCKDCQV